MFVWEAQLHVRKCAVEGKLSALRMRWLTTSNTRDGVFEGTSSYIHLSERMTGIEQQIDRELEELAFVEGLFNVGPIKGGEIALVVRRTASGQKIDVPKSRSIMNIMEDRAEDYREGKIEGVTADEAALIAQGLDEAFAICVNPYPYLTDDERAAYDLIGPEVEKAVERPKTGSQIARDMIESEEVTRTPKRQSIKAPATLATAVAESDDDDDDAVVVRRRA